MLEVQIENIIPVTEARDKFNQIVDAVEGTEELYVMTKNGKPAAIVVGIHHLEKLTGESQTAVFGGENNSNPAMPQAVTPVDSMPAPANAAQAPVTDFSAMPPVQVPINEAPAISPIAPPAPSEAITYDNSPQQIAASSTPVSIPADNVSNATPIDSPLIEPSSASAAGQAIAPDAITPDQAGPSADPFAIPNEPLDMQEDNQASTSPAPIGGSSDMPATPPPMPATNDTLPTPPPAPQV